MAGSGRFHWDDRRHDVGQKNINGVTLFYKASALVAYVALKKWKPIHGAKLARLVEPLAFGSRHETLNQS
jgi:hypothetical protein